MEDFLSSTPYDAAEHILRIFGKSRTEKSLHHKGRKDEKARKSPLKHFKERDAPKTRKITVLKKRRGPEIIMKRLSFWVSESLE